MQIDKQIGLLLDLVHDIVDRDEPVEYKRDKILEHCEKLDRLGDAFAELISWFKVEQE